MQRQQQQRSHFPLLVLLLLVASNSAELSPRASRLAENLGILLGLPLDVHMPRPNASEVPDFIMDVYNCWTALRGSNDRASCLPMSSTETSKDLNDVNVVRGIKSAGIQTATDGFYSHSSPPNTLPASLAFNFNVSLRRVKEDVRYVFIRIGKRSLTATDQNYVIDQCTDPAFTLTLLANVHSNETEMQGAFTPLASAQLDMGDIGEEMKMEFSPITNQFDDWLKQDAESAGDSRDMVELRLIVNGCDGKLSPEHLGFNEKSSAFVIVFSKSDDSEEALIKAGLSELAAEATASREKRQVDGRNQEGTDDAFSNPANTTDHPQATFNITHYQYLSCRRYSHTISFAELGWNEHIFQPLEYEANFCAGSCEYPLNGNYNTTKHSYIQSLAAKLNPQLVPPPCCAPHELRPVTVIYIQSDERFVTHEWHGMRAESCGCK